MKKHVFLVLCLFFQSFAFRVELDADYLIPEEVTYTSVEALGIQRQLMVFTNDKGQQELIGSLGIMAKEQLSNFDSSIFANIDLTLLPPDVIDLINLVQSVKCELNTTLDRVALLCDLYICPKFRGQGYAQRFLQNISQEIFTTTDTNFIVLEPHPFEYENNQQKSLIGSPEFEEKKERLIKLYEDNGFVPCQGKALFMYLERK